MGETAIIDDAQSCADQNSCEDGMGDVPHHARQAEQNGEQEEAMNDAGRTMPSAGPDIDGRPHERTGAGNSSKKGSGHVAHPLANKLPITVVMGSGDVVSDERCRESVYRPKEGKLE